jgi:uncharacterized membrane protein YjgN (DUF898 family)
MNGDTDQDIYKANTADDGEDATLQPRAMMPLFTGTTGGYFKIWIVNVVLTIITLGFFTPWAKVRTRRYFYVNTRLGADPFDYLADPKRLLYGYLILVAFLVCYNYLPTINPLLSLPVLAVGIVGFPWVIYKSRRFFCRNSSFRNVRYRFTGTLGEAYASYLGLPLLIPFTLGLAQPYVFFRQKEYFFNNVSFGGRKSAFSGTSGFFFKLYYSAFAIMVGFMILYFMAVFPAMNTADMGVANQAAMVFPIMAFYLLLFFGGFILNAMVTNYCWNNTEFPGCARFFSSIHPVRYAWIEISNAVLSVLSLGLLIPWAKVRMYRYRMNRLAVELYPELDHLVAEQVEQDDGAFGDMAADEFDFEIGL